MNINKYLNPDVEHLIPAKRTNIQAVDNQEGKTTYTIGQRGQEKWMIVVCSHYRLDHFKDAIKSSSYSIILNVTLKMHFP